MCIEIAALFAENPSSRLVVPPLHRCPSNLTPIVTTSMSEVQFCRGIFRKRWNGRLQKFAYQNRGTVRRKTIENSLRRITPRAIGNLAQKIRLFFFAAPPLREAGGSHKNRLSLPSRGTHGRLKIFVAPPGRPPLRGGATCPLWGGHGPHAFTFIFSGRVRKVSLVSNGKLVG